MKLYEAITLGNVPLRNRFVMAPMTTYSGRDDFHVSNEELAYYEARSKTLGLVITAATSINEQAQAFSKQISLKNDAFIPSMQVLARVIQKQGAKAVVQLHHGGRMNEPSLYEDKAYIVSASAVKAPRDSLAQPRALETEEVKQTINDFVKATERAIKAGFDGVELHGANTYLLQQFFSPHSNRRKDAYGGTLKKRMQFAIELIEKTKACIDKHAKRPFMLGYRFSPEELETPGITIEDTMAFVKKLKTLPLDYLHISLGHYKQSSIRDVKDKTPLVEKIQSALNHEIPLIGVGQIESLEDAKDALTSGYDLVAAGMPLIADPNWVETIKTSKPNKLVKTDTLPKPLFDRLYKNRQRFAAHGYHFELE